MSLLEALQWLAASRNRQRVQSQAVNRADPRLTTKPLAQVNLEMAVFWCCWMPQSIRRLIVITPSHEEVLLTTYCFEGIYESVYIALFEAREIRELPTASDLSGSSLPCLKFAGSHEVKPAKDPARLFRPPCKPGPLKGPLRVSNNSSSKTCPSAWPDETDRMGERSLCNHLMIRPNSCTDSTGYTG